MKTIGTATLWGLAQVVMIDLMLASDKAVVIGMAVLGLSALAPSERSSGRRSIRMIPSGIVRTWQYTANLVQWRLQMIHEPLQ